ncbi:MAG TPA: hypothetical protein VGJ86_11365 [Acidimicrobiales bacterium]
MSWPVARLDRIARLRALASGFQGGALHEAVLDAPFDDAWAWLSDLERTVPDFDEDVARLRIIRREPHPEGGERLRIHTRNTAIVLWMPTVLDAHLASGWCWMATRPLLYVIGMAAEPEGDRTRFAHFEGLAFQAPRLLQPVLRPVLAASRWRHDRHVPRDLAAIERHFRSD